MKKNEPGTEWEYPGQDVQGVIVAADIPDIDLPQSTLLWLPLQEVLTLQFTSAPPKMLPLKKFSYVTIYDK